MAEKVLKKRQVKIKTEVMQFIILSLITSFLFLSVPYIEKSAVSARSIAAIVMALAGITTVALLRSYSHISILMVRDKIHKLEFVNDKHIPLFTLIENFRIFIVGPHLLLVIFGVSAFIAGFKLLRHQYSPLLTEFGQVLILVSGMTSIAVFRALVTPPFRTKAKYRRD